MSVLYIAEIGLNHNREINLAKDMVAAALDACASAIKFQSINYRSLITEEVTKISIENY